MFEGLSEHVLDQLDRASSMADPHTTEVSLSCFGYIDSFNEIISDLLPSSNVHCLQVTNGTMKRPDMKSLMEAVANSSVVSLDMQRCSLKKADLTELTKMLPRTNLIECLVDDSEAKEAEIARATGNRSVLNSTINEVCPELFAQIEAITQKNLQKLQRRTKGFLEAETFTEEEWETACDQMLAMRKCMELSGFNNINGRLLDKAEIAMEAGLPVVEFVAKLLPLEEAAAWFDQHGHALGAADFLKEDGTLPTDQFLCHGGIPALFRNETLWDDANQLATAVDSLPEPAKKKVANIYPTLVNMLPGQTSGSTLGR